MSLLWYLPTNTELPGHGPDDYVLTPAADGLVAVGRYGDADSAGGPTWLGEVGLDALPEAVRTTVSQATEPVALEHDDDLLRTLEGAATAHDDKGA